MVKPYLSYSSVETLQSLSNTIETKRLSSMVSNGFEKLFTMMDSSDKVTIPMVFPDDDFTGISM